MSHLPTITTRSRWQVYLSVRKHEHALRVIAPANRRGENFTLLQWGLASEIAAAYAMATASAKGGTSDAERAKTTKQSERIKKDGLRACALLR